MSNTKINILGISAFYHDSAAAIVQDGHIVAAAHEERFSRIKQDASFPKQAIRFCLTYSGLTLNELDAIVFYDKPLLKFERLLETYYANAPKGWRSFVHAMPVWMKEKMFLKKILRDELSIIDATFTPKKARLLFPEHHLSHAASAFYPSPFNKAAILTVDGVGEWATSGIFYGEGTSIRKLKELRFPHSLGLLYSAFTYYLGFRVNRGEYKLMGLAPYGNPESERVATYVKKIKDTLVHIQEDGSLWLNQDYFKYSTGLQMADDKKWTSLFGFPRREAETELAQHHCDLGLAIQQVTEEVVIKMAKTAKKLTNAPYLCMAGGVALNCVANGKLLRTGLFKDIFIQPAAGDAGGALGAALSAYHIYYKKSRPILAPTALDHMQASLLGPEYSDLAIRLVAKKFKAPFTHYTTNETLCSAVAELIAKGKVVGWFQGRMEYGPRALGNRSILGDARNPAMQKKLNLKIKYRESFRPFAPSVLAEDAVNYFDCDKASPYMLLVADVCEKRRKSLPENYHNLALKEKLYHLRSDIPAVTHIDFSARVQTVHQHSNPKYWQLLQAFKALTGYSLIVNTSFNVRGEPIVCSPTDAFNCFLHTEMDYLVLHNFVFDKRDMFVEAVK